MELKDKAVVLVEFLQVEFTNSIYDEFFQYNDLGMPLAISVDADLCTLTDEGKKILEETYNLLCDELGIDRKDYASYDDMLEAMPKN